MTNDNKPSLSSSFYILHVRVCTLFVTDLLQSCGPFILYRLTLIHMKKINALFLFLFGYYLSFSMPTENPHSYLGLLPFALPPSFFPLCRCAVCFRPSHRVPTPPSSITLHVATAGNHLNEEIIPLLPTGIGKQYSQTISNLGHASLLRCC